VIITSDHLLDTARPALLSPSGGPMNIRRALVIHFTNGATAQSSIEYWRSLGNGTCAHLVIDRDGTIFQCRPFNRTAGHAGVSRWRDPKSGALYPGANAFAIGIELANAGNDGGVIEWARKHAPEFAGTMLAKHRNGGAVERWEQFPLAQLAACESAAKALVARYNLDDITGHDCIAPERKNDPGPAFPMQALREACGFTGLPEVFTA
jgi:N-acetylmuramoyl-L-alanine amidase